MHHCLTRITTQHTHFALSWTLTMRNTTVGSLLTLKTGTTEKHKCLVFISAHQKVFSFHISISQKCLIFILAHHKSVWFSYQHITKCFSRAAGRGNHLHQHSILTQSLKSGLFEPCCPSSNHTECWPCISISRQSLIAVVLYCLCQQSRILIHHWFVFAPAKQIEKKTCVTRIVKHN